MRINRGFQQEKSRNRVIEPSENLYVCITNVIFFSLLSFDPITISKVDKRTCSQRSAETSKYTQLRSKYCIRSLRFGLTETAGRYVTDTPSRSL